MEQVQDMKTAVERVRQGESREALAPLLGKMARFDVKYMSAKQKSRIADMNDFLEKKIDSKYESMASPWFQFFYNYDAGPALEDLQCPVLMIIGGRDLQVPVKENRKNAMKALSKGGNQDITIKVFPQANHIYQTAKTGSESEYPELPQEFTPGFLEYLSSWIAMRVGISQ